MALVSTSFTMHRHHIQINMFDVCGYMVTDSGSLYLIHNAQTSQMGARRKGKRAERVLIPPPTPSPHSESTDSMIFHISDSKNRRKTLKNEKYQSVKTLKTF